MISLVARRTAIAAPRRTTALANSVRMYSDGDRSAGATASSTSFKSREQAEEAQYIRKQEQEKLRKLQESIKQQREHLDKLEKEVKDATSKGN